MILINLNKQTNKKIQIIYYFRDLPSKYSPSLSQNNGLNSRLQNNPITEEPPDGKFLFKLEFLILFNFVNLILSVIIDSQADIDSDSEDEVDLLYDPALDCYYDPKTSTYYALNMD